MIRITTLIFTFFVFLFNLKAKAISLGYMNIHHGRTIYISNQFKGKFNLSLRYTIFNQS